MIESGMAIKDEMIIDVGKGFNDGFRLKGVFEGILYDQFGKEIDRRKVSNLVTTEGFKIAADQLLTSPSLAKPNWMELGTGTGQTADSTILAAYISGSRTVLSAKTRGSNAVITMSCTFGAGIGTGAITEAGIFNVVTQNTANLMLYSSFAVVNKGANDSFTVNWTLTFQA